MTKNKRILKIVELTSVATYKDKNYLYALADNGRIYFGEHDPVVNGINWTEIVNPKSTKTGRLVEKS